ncbi:MAG: hypothetical protein ACRD9R_05480, partial [Pyrinomonadaceae bacterium]
MSLLFVMLCAESVAACSCGGSGAPCEAYGRASAVFVGTVTSVRQRKIDSVEVERKREDASEYLPALVYTFAVQDSFSGVGVGEVEVGSGSGGGDCGYEFVKGAQYVVYAYRDPRNNLLSTSICTRTRPVTAADEDLAFLRSLSGRAGGVTISGAVRMSHHSAAVGAPPPADKRLAGLPLVIEGEGVRRELRTDADGRYEVTGLKAGTYTIKVALPDELFTYRAEEKVTLTERGCGNASFYVADNGRISGTVFDADGQPVSKILLYLMRAEDVGAERPQWTYAEADEAGQFTFRPLAPGSYLIGVRLGGLSFPDAAGNAYPRTFYPGVSEATQATLITLSRAGEHVSERVFRLPPRLVERIIGGSVVLPGGRYAAKAFVTYQELGEANSSSSYGAESDEQGRF